MFQPFIRKLRHGANLSQDDEKILANLIKPLRNMRARHDLSREGSEPRVVPIVLDGWACRYRMLENGRRQITALYLPGDLCEPFGVLPRCMDDTIVGLTPVSLAYASLAAIGSAVRSNPRIEEALWWDLLLATSIDHERLASVGRRTALERVGHLFCEVHQRLRLVDLADSSSCDWLINQFEISDLLGLSAVHVNRSLRQLREAGLITLQGHRLIIHDLDKLRALSYFDPSYFHVDGSSSL